MRCLLYTSDAADDLTRVDLGGRVVRTSDLRFAVAGLPPGHDTAWLFISETGDRLSVGG